MAKSPFSSARTLGDLLRVGLEELNNSSSTPRLDCEVLLGAMLGLSRTGVLVSLRDSCSADQSEVFAGFIVRRKAGEPVAYITGEREFWGLRFQVTPAVLIPRPESELVIEAAVAHLTGMNEARLLDLGAGSGCLAISLVKELSSRGVRVLVCDAVDKSPAALEVARANAVAHSVEGAISFVESDWCSAAAKMSPPYDCIVANPPYVDRGEHVTIELSFEPASALFAEHKGLRDVVEVLRQATPLLKPGGVLLCEVGAGKRLLLPYLVAQYENEFEVSLLGDDSEFDRFCVVKLVRRRQR